MFFKNDDKSYTMVDLHINSNTHVHKNTSFVIEDNYRYGHNKVVIALHSVINDRIKTSLVQHRY